jgi:PadR family transcriptional regulator PadR
MKSWKSETRLKVISVLTFNIPLCRAITMAQISLPRLSYQALRVLQEFLKDPTQELSGADLIKALKLPSGTIYPLLFRFERVGLLESQWEEADASALNRPRRRLYLITQTGCEVARKALADLSVLGLSPAFKGL